MPVKSSTTSVLRWPDRISVDRAVRAWLPSQLEGKEVVRVGYFGSYARGDWGPGSDLDLVAIVAESSRPFDRRTVEWDTTALPVPADLVVYTEAEWDALDGSRFHSVVEREAVWIWPAPAKA